MAFDRLVLYKELTSILVFQFGLDNEGIDEGCEQLDGRQKSRQLDSGTSITLTLAEVEVEILQLGRDQHDQQAEGDQVEADCPGSVVDQ